MWFHTSGCFCKMQVARCRKPTAITCAMMMAAPIRMVVRNQRGACSLNGFIVFRFRGSGFKGREGFSRLITIPARVDGLTGGVEAPPAGEAYIIQRVTENYLGSTTTLTSSWFYPYLWAVFYDLTMLNYYHNFISGFRFRGSDVIFFIVDAVMVNPERPFDV